MTKQRYDQRQVKAGYEVLAIETILDTAHYLGRGRELEIPDYWNSESWFPPTPDIQEDARSKTQKSAEEKSRHRGFRMLLLAVGSTPLAEGLASIEKTVEKALALGLFADGDTYVPVSPISDVIRGIGVAGAVTCASSLLLEQNRMARVVQVAESRARQILLRDYGLVLDLPAWSESPYRRMIRCLDSLEDLELVDLGGRAEARLKEADQQLQNVSGIKLEHRHECHYLAMTYSIEAATVGAYRGQSVGVR